jgi:hypothetical protein
MRTLASYLVKDTKFDDIKLYFMDLFIFRIMHIKIWQKSCIFPVTLIYSYFNFTGSRFV